MNGLCSPARWLTQLNAGPCTSRHWSPPRGRGCCCSRPPRAPPSRASPSRAPPIAHPATAASLLSMSTRRRPPSRTRAPATLPRGFCCPRCRGFCFPRLCPPGFCCPPGSKVLHACPRYAAPRVSLPSVPGVLLPPALPPKVLVPLVPGSCAMPRHLRPRPPHRPPRARWPSPFSKRMRASLMGAAPPRGFCCPRCQGFCFPRLCPHGFVTPRHAMPGRAFFRAIVPRICVPTRHRSSHPRPIAPSFLAPACHHFIVPRTRAPSHHCQTPRARLRSCLSRPPPRHRADVHGSRVHPAMRPRALIVASKLARSAAHANAVPHVRAAKHRTGETFVTRMRMAPSSRAARPAVTHRVQNKAKKHRARAAVCAVASDSLASAAFALV